MATTTIGPASIASSTTKLLTSTKTIIGNPTWDVAIIVLFLAIGFFYGISATNKKIINAILLTYVGIAIFPLIPSDAIAKSASQPVYYVKPAIFLALFILLNILLGERGKVRGPRTDPWWQLFLLGFIQAGLLLHELFRFFPEDQIKRFSFFTREAFASPRTALWWLILPLIILMIARKSEHPRRS